MKKFRLIPILLALTLSGCIAQNTNTDQKPDGGDTPAQPNDGGSTPSQDVPVSSISVTPSSLTLKEEETAQLEATVLPENATYEKINWSTGDESVASVDPNGLIRAGTRGSTTITASIGDKTASCSVTVEPKPAEDPVDYLSNVKLNLNSDFTSYENKTFVTNKISKVTLDYVEDGDTVHFKEGENSLTIRMAYIDCPSDTEAWGHEAYQLTQALMLQAKTIVITNATLKSSDPVVLNSTGERYLGFIWYSRKENAEINELRCLNLEMVNEGYSNIFNGAEDPLHGYFLYCLSSAQQAKKNMWENYVAPENDYGYDHYDGYYGTLTWENGEDLKQKLYTIIHTGYTALPYKTPNWETNQYADQDLYNHDQVNLVYSNDTLPKEFTSKQGNGGWQREHAFCASLMTGSLSATAVDTLGRATDFHNLFAASEKGNTSRGNKNFGMADPSDSGYQSTGHYKCDTKNFEPSDFDKGRLARAIFYMGVMYSVSENANYQPLRIVEEYVDYTEGNCQYAIGNLSTLLSWNYNKVDFLEYQHNESVYSHVYSGVNKAQGNRNPFVDYPELVDYVYGAKKDSAGDIKSLRPTEDYLAAENPGTVYYAIKDVNTSYMVGDTFSSADYTLLKVDNKLNETPAETSEDLTQSYEFVTGDIGDKTLTVKTPINDINIKATVTEYKDTFNIADCKYYSGDPLTKANYVSQLSNVKSTLAITADLDITIAQYSTNGIKIPKTFSKITITSQSLEEIDKIGIKTNANKNGKYQIQIKVGDTQVYQESLTGLGTGVDPMESLVKLASPLDGVVTITITPVSSIDAIYIATLGINAK